MDYKNTIASIESILKLNDNLKENNCILINGEWGIGKTYAIQEWMNSNESKYNFKYISVFGKEKVRDIENEILIKLASLLSYRESRNNRINRNRAGVYIKSVTTVGLQVLSNKTGIAFEAAEYMKNISIEELTDPEINGKKTIICIDDLERKSDIRIIDLLGLIERTTQNYNVIIIANTNQLSNEEQNELKKYKEKVIDYEFVVDKIERSLQERILRNVFDDDLDLNEIDLILDNYNKAFKIDKETMLINELFNIRVYKKYISLIYKVVEAIKITLKVSDYKITNDIVGNCKSTVCMYYFADKYKDIKEEAGVDITLRNGELIEVFRAIFMGEVYNKKRLKELVSTDSEISEDIKRIYSAFKLRREDTDELFSKVNRKIEEKDLEYFSSQHNVISLYDALISYGCLKDHKNKLIKIAESLYIATTKKNIPQYDSSDWFDVEFWGGPIQCSSETSNFIKLINQKNQEKYREYKMNMIEEAMSERDIAMIVETIKEMDIVKEGTFKMIFDLGWNSLDGPQHDEVWELLYKLIEKSERKPTDKFFKFFETDRLDDIQNKRLKHLKDFFNDTVHYKEHMEVLAALHYAEPFEE